MPSSAPSMMPTSAPSVATRAPTVIPGDGLEAWYIADTIQDPDGSNVSFWMDSSGNNHHVNQSDSILMPRLKANAMNGHKTLQFGNPGRRLTGIDSWKDELLAGQDGLTAFVVINNATRDWFPIDRGYYSDKGEKDICRKFDLTFCKPLSFHYLCMLSLRKMQPDSLRSLSFFRVGH